MKKIKKLLFNNELIKTSFLTGIGTVIAQVSGLAVSKIIAITLGTKGVAMISQFIDFITMSTSMATGGIQQGVVKYVAEFKNNRNELAKVLSTSFKISMIFALVVGLLIYIFSKTLSDYLFQSDDFVLVFKIFAGNIFLFVLNTLLIKILNGIGEIKKLVLVNISNSLFGLLITSSAAYFLGLNAALIALSVSQSVVFFISLLFVAKSDWYDWELFKLWFDKENIIKFLKFTLMGICMLILPPLVNIGIRNNIIENLSFNDAGIWSGITKISNSYLGIITLTLSYYYLPKLSSLTDKSLIRKEIISGYKILIPALVVLMIAIFIFRDFIIRLIYTKDFLEMKGLFAMKLFGDFFRIASYILSYLMLAKAKTTMFITTSIIFSGIYYSLSILLIHNRGLIGAINAYTTEYILYFFTMIFLLGEYIYEKQ